MPTINKYPTEENPSSGDLFVLFSVGNSDTRKVSLSSITSYILSQYTPSSTAKNEFITQYSAPSATGFSVSINDNSDNTWLILTPTAGFAAGTIVLPTVANAADKQEILINTTQQVTTLTIDGNGAAGVSGAPTSLGAYDYFRLKFDATVNTWYRVG